MNQPYVKLYENGQLKNPIKGSYLHSEPNRRKRREHKHKEPFFGCGKNTPLTVTKEMKYLRVRQIEKDKDGNRKTIEHYILK